MTPDPAPPDGPPPQRPAVPASTARAAAAYSLARVVVFAVVLLLLALVGLRGFPLVLVALAVSGVVSYLALARLRAPFAAAIESQVQRRREARRRADDDLGQ